MLLNNLVEPEIAIYCGYTITSLTGFLLFINFIVILVVSVQAIKRKCELRTLRKAALANQKAKLAIKAKLQKKSNQQKSESESSERSSVDPSQSSFNSSLMSYSDPKALI